MVRCRRTTKYQNRLCSLPFSSGPGLIQCLQIEVIFKKNFFLMGSVPNITLTLLKVNNLVEFSSLTVLWNHYFCLVPKHLLTQKKI